MHRESLIQVAASNLQGFGHLAKAIAPQILVVSRRVIFVLPCGCAKAFGRSPAVCFDETRMLAKLRLKPLQSRFRLLTRTLPEAGYAPS